MSDVKAIQGERVPRIVAHRQHAASRSGTAEFDAGPQLRGFFCLLQALHLCILATLQHPFNPHVLAVSGIANSVLYLIVIRYELHRSPPFISPWIVFLCSGFLRLGLATCWAAAAAIYGYRSALRVGPVDVYPSLLQGYVILVCCEWLVCCAYIMADRRVHVNRTLRRLSVSEIGSGTTPATFVVLIVVGGILSLAFLFRVPGIRSTVLFGMLVNSMPEAGMLLLLFYSASRPTGIRRAGYAVCAVLVAFFFVTGLSGYMKGSAVLVLLPPALFCMTAFRKSFTQLVGETERWKAVAFAAIGATVVLIVFPYFNLRRAAILSAKGQAVREVSVREQFGEALEGAIPGTDAFARSHAFPRGGMWSFLGRQCYIPSAAWAVTYVERYGTVNGDFVRQGIVSLVPRIFWTGKPIYNPGAQITVMLGGARDAESATTSTDAGLLAGGLFLNYGWLGLIVGSLLAGFLLCVFSKVLLRHLSKSAVAATATMMLYVQAGTGFANGIDGNAGAWVTLALLAGYVLFRAPK